MASYTTDNPARTTDPSVNEDCKSGWTVGTRWINTTTGNEFTCTDNSVGAAVWEIVSRDVSFVGALTAAGTGQSDALAITKGVNIGTTTASGTGWRLPALPKTGEMMTISNRGANTGVLYPATGGTIDGGSANAGINVAANAKATVVHGGSNAWWTI